MKLSKKRTITCLMLLVASIIIILVVSNSTFSFPIRSSTSEIRATRLAVIINGDNVQHPGKYCNLIIRAVDDEGVLDTKRNDTIRVLVEAGPTAKVNREMVILKNGQAEIEVVTFVSELVYIRAVWESGPSYLASGQNVVVYL